jgi:myo-inositol-1(or 4)-monophosphatase
VTGSPDPLEVALAAAGAAGEILGAAHGRPVAARSKGAAVDLVTEFDQASERAIVAKLAAAFPDDQIVAEEGGARGAAAEARWLVDPLDGTTNFAHGLPIYCVSIARERAGVLEVGVVHAPALGLTFAARRGAGATCNGEPIRVSAVDGLERALLVTGFPYDRHTSAENNFDQFAALQRRAQGVRRLGAAALDLAWVARGVLDGYWEMKLKPWDLAAGALLVEEAGGRVTDWRGGEVAIDRGAAVATNGRIHDALVAALGELPIPPAAG